MPYITPKERERYNTVLKHMPDIKTKGDLEYCVTYLMKRFMSTRDFRYSTLHDSVYAVAHCADEFRRLYLDKRENEARETNGDVNV